MSFCSELVELSVLSSTFYCPLISISVYLGWSYICLWVPSSAPGCNQLPCPTLRSPLPSHQYIIPSEGDCKVYILPFLHTNISFLQREIARYTFSPSYTPICPSFRGSLQGRFSHFLHTKISLLQREIAM